MITSILTLAYIGGLIGGTWIFAFRSKTFLHHKSPVPTGEKMMREPGHSLGLEVEKRMERCLLTLAFLCLGPIPFLASAGKAPTGLLWFGLSSWVWFFLLFGAGFACSFFLSKQIRSLANYFLGLRGERLVGEMLHSMLKDGFEVFHDFPIEPDGKTGNIDHILVGPNGVFAIETKTYRKPTEATDGKNYEVKFDGKKLRFPHRTTKKGIGQATHNARLLSKHLSQEAGQTIGVAPVLTLPGWFVDSTSWEPLLVLNPKGIRKILLNKPVCLDDELIRKICIAIERRCRDVEF